MSRLSELRRTKERRDEINLAPLIDMIFILLIFFVVTTTFVKELEVEIERPGASSGLKAERGAVRVAIDRGGRIYVAGRPVQFWMIQDRLKSRLAKDPDRPVLVVADKSVPTGRLVEIVDECRLAGAEEVGVDVEPAE